MFICYVGNHFAMSSSPQCCVTTRRLQGEKSHHYRVSSSWVPSNGDEGEQSDQPGDTAQDSHTGIHVVS